MAAAVTKPAAKTETSFDEIMTTLKEVKSSNENLKTRMDEMTKVNRRYTPGEVFARTGEDSMSSRGYSFLKMMGAIAGVIPWENAKIEKDIHDRLQKAYVQGGGYRKAMDNSCLAPVFSLYLADVNEALALEIRQITKAGV